MAGFTINFLRIGMSPAEEKLCPAMIEGLFVDRSNVFGSPFVFSMAVLTLMSFLEPSVKSLFVIDILAYVLVAVQAERRLRSFVEALVTLRAAVFPFGMSFNDWARH